MLHLPTGKEQQKVHCEELKIAHYPQWRAATSSNTLNYRLTHTYIMQFSSFTQYIQPLLAEKADYRTNKRKEG